MARLCFVLAVVSPLALPLGWLLISYAPGQPVLAVHNAPGLVLLAISPVAFLASAILGIQLLLRRSREHTGWLAAALVIDYCWFHICCAALVIQTIRG